MACAFVTAVELALHLSTNSRLLAEKRRMIYYKQFGFVSSAFSGYENDISDVRGPMRGEQTMVPASHTAKRKAVRRLRLE